MFGNIKNSFSPPTPESLCFSEDYFLSVGLDIALKHIFFYDCHSAFHILRRITGDDNSGVITFAELRML